MKHITFLALLLMLNAMQSFGQIFFSLDQTLSTVNSNNHRSEGTFKFIPLKGSIVKESSSFSEKNRRVNAFENRTISNPVSGTSLSAGDLAIIWVQADIPDDFAFVTFVNVDAGTVIYFTDAGTFAGGGFPSSSTEGVVQYTAPIGGLSAGSTVKYSESASDFSTPTDSRFNGSLNFAASGDQLIVYQSATSPTGVSNASGNPKFIFIAQLSSTVFTGDANDSNQSSLPAGLSDTSDPKTALGLGVGSGTQDEWDNVVYKGQYVFTSIADAKASITNLSNWHGTNSPNVVDINTGLAIDATYTNAINNIPSQITIGTTDTDAPVFDVAPATSSVTASGFTVGASIDEGGDIYYVVVADGATAPTSANVIAGQANGGGVAIKSGNGTSLADPFTLSSAVTGLAAGTAYDVYVVARDDEGTPNVQASVTKVDVSTLAPSSLQVAATVFLEGAWNGTAAMHTTLEDADLVSASAPYNGTNSHAGSESVASAASVPDGAVDWVLVELREAGSAATATNATRKGTTAGFLMSDGTIKATDGLSNLTINLSGNTGTDYYVVIYHRNHLPIMSANAIAGSSGTLTIDFTTNSANTYQTTTALVSLAGSKFGMPAGDSNGDGSINTTDLGTWRTNNGAVYSYSGNGVSDFNLDGVINAVDRNGFHQKNTAKTRQVPST
ncbi:hypothetical protein [Roseivirga sp.]|uniref:hypothetical protein n=1 Tax=Roseivirga sp. TaxID=1964215 RepID=UPI003B8E69B9